MASQTKVTNKTYYSEIEKKKRKKKSKRDEDDDEFMYYTYGYEDPRSGETLYKTVKKSEFVGGKGVTITKREKRNKSSSSSSSGDGGKKESSAEEVWEYGPYGRLVKVSSSSA